MERQVDVCIVGGGIAGLSCARILADGGATVAVLEARGRVGGRTESARIGGATFDLGGQWLGPTQQRMLKLCGDLGIETFPTFDRGARVLDVAGKRQTYKGTIPKMSPRKLVALQRALMRTERMAKRIPADAPWDAEEAAGLDAQSIAVWSRPLLRHPTTRATFNVAVRTIFGAEASEVSTLYFLWLCRVAGGFTPLVEVSDGAQETRFVEGAQRVSLAIAEHLGDAVAVSAPVRRIEQDGNGVTVRSDAGEVRARRCVVAMPPVMNARIEFDPPLPVAREHLAQRFPMGSYIKWHALYEAPFWRDDGLSGEAVFTDPRPVSVSFDNTSHDGAQPALVGFVAGAQARELARRSPGERRDAVLEALARAFGPAARRATEYVDKDWQAEVWTRGCPVAFLPPGVLTGYGPALREPAGRIHWAGTETATEWSGYMEGAVQSAGRAAAEVLASL